ncbi:NAD(+)/NADH kinase [Halobellus sp. Atlit-31R]|nr:NAD(+)/NADH kinase [Halobellus sp. Atlit-31R]
MGPRGTLSASAPNRWVFFPQQCSAGYARTRAGADEAGPDGGGSVSRTSVAVVSDLGSTGDAVADAVAAHEAVHVERTTPTDGAVSVDDDVEAVFAVGEEALIALGASEFDEPVVPVDVGAGRYELSSDAVTSAADALVRAAFETVPHPVLEVDVGGATAGVAVTDVTLLTSEPARISEYAIESPNGWRDTVRSDGVVVATPLGSAGYARDAGGPLLAPETGLVAVPISPYAMHADSWVLRPPTSLSVERDEAAVSLLLDDDSVRSVPPQTPIQITVGRELSLVRPQTLGDG